MTGNKLKQPWCTITFVLWLLGCYFTMNLFSNICRLSDHNSNGNIGDLKHRWFFRQIPLPPLLLTILTTVERWRLNSLQMNIGLVFNCKNSCDRQGNTVKQGLLLFLPSPSINRHTELNVAITIWCYVFTAKTVSTEYYRYKCRPHTSSSNV